MSIKTTQIMTRKELIQHIIWQLSTVHEELLEKFSNIELEDMAERLDEMDDNPFTNYLVQE